MGEQFPELERDQLVHDALHSLDIPALVTRIHLIEIAIEWNLAIIPDHTPLLPLISSRFQEVLTICEGMPSYQYNLSIRDDVIPSFLQHCIVESISDEIANLSVPANSSPSIQGVEVRMSEGKRRHFSSSSSSRTSEACFLSAEEDASITEELFYDPLRMELLEAFNLSIEAPVKLEVVDIMRMEVQPEIQFVCGDHEANAYETLMLYSENNEPQGIVSLGGEYQSDIFDLLDRSSESLFMAETTTRLEGDQRPSVRFNENQEIILIGDEYSDEEKSNDGSIYEEEILVESKAEDNQSSVQINNLKLATEQMEEFHVETLAELALESDEALQNSDAKRTPLVDKNLADENEIVIGFQSVSTEDKILLSDARERASPLKISTSFDKAVAEPTFIAVSSATVTVQNLRNEDAKSLKISRDITHSILDSALKENQQTGIHETVSEFEELKEETIEETQVSIYEQSDLEFQRKGTTASVHLESAQVHEIPLEMAEEIVIESEIFLTSIVHIEMLRYCLLDDAESRDQTEENGGPPDRQSKFESQIQAAVSKTDLKSLQTHENESELTEEIVLVLKSSANLVAKMESPKYQIAVDLQSIEEKIQENSETINENDNLVFQSQSTAPISCMGLDNAFENLLEWVEIFKELSMEFTAQVEPSKVRVLAGETELIPSFQDASKSKRASLSKDEKNQAGSSEKSSAFDNSGDSTSSLDALEQIVVKKGCNVAVNVSLSMEVVKYQNTDTVKQDAMSGGLFDSQDPQYLHYVTVLAQENSSESFDEAAAEAESYVKLDIQREPMNDQIKVGKSEISLYSDRKLTTHEVNMILEENQQVGNFEISPDFDTTYAVASYTDLNSQAFIDQTKVFGDAKVILAPSDLKPAYNDRTLLDNLQTGSKEKIDEKKLEYFAESALATEAHLQFGTEQLIEIDLENSEDLLVKEAIDEDPKSKLQTLTDNDSTEGFALVPQFDGLSPENKIPFFVEKIQAGSSEIAASFSENRECSPLFEYFDEGLVTAIQVKVLYMKIAEDKPIPADVRVHLQRESEVSINADSDTISEAENLSEDGSKFKEADIKFDSQVPISPKEIDLEVIEDLDMADNGVGNLQPEKQPAEYYLSLKVEFRTLEQPFDMLGKNADFEEHNVKGRRQSINDKLTTLSAEIATTDDSKSELDQCSVRKLYEEGKL